MNGFTKHGLNHTSASQINMYANSPDAWVAKYLFGKKFSGSIAMQVGVEVENAIVNVLARGFSVEDSKANAQKAIKKYCGLGLNITSADQKRIEGMDGMIDQGIEYLSQFGEPEFEGDIINGGQQKKVELLCKGEGWELPVIGYLDLYYPKLGKIIDIKTTMAAPSNMSTEHLRQGAIYKGANNNYAVEFVYITPKKYVCHAIEEYRNSLVECKAILTRQEKLLNKMSKEEIAEIIPLTDTYYWNGSEDVKKELYGI